jgi:hypothetical protein
LGAEDGDLVGGWLRDRLPVPDELRRLRGGSHRNDVECRPVDGGDDRWSDERADDRDGAADRRAPAAAPADEAAGSGVPATDIAAAVG